MKIFFISALTFCLHTMALAQQLQQRDANPIDLDSADMDAYYAEDQESLIDEAPKFKGKNADFNAYIMRHTNYPQEAKSRSIEGVVYVSYVIGTNGKIQDLCVVQSSNTLLDAAAVEVIANAPKWKPAEYKRKPVPFKKISKITFRL